MTTRLDDSKAVKSMPPRHKTEAYSIDVACLSLCLSTVTLLSSGQEAHIMMSLILLRFRLRAINKAGCITINHLL